MQPVNVNVFIDAIVKTEMANKWIRDMTSKSICTTYLPLWTISSTGCLVSLQWQVTQDTMECELLQLFMSQLWSGMGKEREEGVGRRMSIWNHWPQPHITSNVMHILSTKKSISDQKHLVIQQMAQLSNLRRNASPATYLPSTAEMRKFPFSLPQRNPNSATMEHTVTHTHKTLGDES